MCARSSTPRAGGSSRRPSASRSSPAASAPDHAPQRGERTMRRWMKISAAAVLGLGLVAAAAVAVAVQIGERKLHRTVEVPAEALHLAASDAGAERGRYLYLTRGCVECHGADGAGRDVVNDGKGMLVHAPNITPGPGS